MALPTILFNATTGSDTAASGAGPATAVTGTAAAHTGGAASTTITLTGTPDLSGVAVDGSACLWMKTASGRQFSKITAADDGANTVTVEDSFTIAEASAVNYAIGGKRATWDDADSRNIRSDAKPGWVIETETNQTISSVITGNCSGDTTNGRITWRGKSGSVRTLTQSSNANHFNSTGTANPTLWRFQNLKFTNSNGTKTAAIALAANGGDWMFLDCIFGDATNRLLSALTRVSNSWIANLHNCEIYNTTSNGVTIATSGNLYLYGSWIHVCGAAGISHPGGAASDLLIRDSLITGNTTDGIVFSAAPTRNISIMNSVLYGNGGDGIDISSGVATTMQIINCQITTNASGYGIRGAAGQANFQAGIDYNNFGTGVTANTTGALLNLASGAHDLAVDPQYTDAANGDFTPLPGSLVIGAASNGGDIGAVQSPYPTLPAAGLVKSGTDRGDGVTGTRTDAPEAKVEADYQYGADGTEFTGALEAGGGGAARVIGSPIIRGTGVQ